MKIAVEGCCHGELDAIYSHIEILERRNGYKVDLLLICGDFQAIRNHQDLQCMAVPQKYRQLGGFYRYYTGEREAPILTLVIGGNHEASNYMWELYHGGWLAPNIYFLGFAGCVNVNGIRIAGASGIYSASHYSLGHFENIPFDNGTMRSIYHIREYDMLRLSQLSHPDICLSHDWPQGIENFGDVKDLLRRKPFFRAEVQSNSLGSPPAMQLLRTIKPLWWFSAHLHCRFEATVVHEHSQAISQVDNPDEIVIEDLDDAETTEVNKVDGPQPSTSPFKLNNSGANPDEILLEDEIIDVALATPVRRTRFLALDKCLPRRQFLEVVDIPTEENPLPPRFEFDPEWLAITRAFHPHLSTGRAQPRLPDGLQAKDMVKKELDWVLENLGDKGSRSGLVEITDCQVFWPTAPGPGSEGANKFRQPPWYTNPQTEAFCRMLEIENKINPVPKGMEVTGQKTASPPPADTSSALEEVDSAGQDNNRS